MLFSTHPKSKIKDLFNRKKELEKLEKSAKEDKIILLYGLRRIGKTSLLKVFQTKTDNFFIFIDCRKFLKGWKIDKQKLDNEVINSLKKISKTNPLKKILDKITSINVSGVGIELKNKNTFSSLSTLLEEIDKALPKEKKLIIAFDEAQLLRFYGIGGRDFLNLLAFSYDNLNNIKYILTGSEIGLLFDFLKIDNPDEPLFGRYLNEIKLSRFEKEKSLEFLKVGFNEIDVQTSLFEREKIVNELDGIVGYLSLFGYEVYKNGNNFNLALEKTKKIAANMIKKELDSLIEKSINYAYVLNAISLGFDRFSRIKKYIEANFGKMYDSTLSNILNSLHKQSFIEVEYYKSNKKYYIPDPLIKEYCNNIIK